MPDFTPDTSIYQQNQISPGSMLGIVKNLRDLQTQNAVSDSLRQSGGDPNAALTSLMRPGAPGIATAGMVTSLAQAAKAKADLQQHYFNTMADIASSYLGSGRPIDDKAVAGMAIKMHQAGVPQDVATNWLNDTMPRNQKDRQLAVTQLQNLRAGGASPDVVWRQTPEGLVPETGAALRYGTYAPPSQDTQAAGGPPPTPQRTLAVGEEGSLETSAKNAQNLQDRAPAISQQRSLLAQMRSELSAAQTGGPALASLRMHVNQTLSGLGLPGLDSEEKMTATQLFNKFSYQLQQQQAGAWPTEKNLGSVFSANPSIALTKLGNSGVLAFLQGNLATENLVLSEWNSWKASHGGGQALNGRFRDWLNDTLPPQLGRGFNARPDEAPGSGGMRNFDPRVLQFEHLPPEEKKQFVAGMSDTEKKVFSRAVNRYSKLDYIEQAQQ